MNNITNLINKYKVQLLIIIIISAIIFMAYFTDSSDEDLNGDRYFIPKSATNEQLNKMKVFQEGKCSGQMPVRIDLREDDQPLETCALYAKGKGWNNFGFKNGICTTGSKLISNVCPTGMKVYNWKEKLERIVNKANKTNKNNSKLPKTNIPVIIKSYIPMFDKTNFEGNKYTLEEGNYATNKDIMFDVDSIKSFLLPPMMGIKIYSEPQFKGRTLKLVNPTGFLDESNINIASKWNYGIGSIEVSHLSDVTQKPIAALFSEKEYKGVVKTLNEGEYTISDLRSQDIREDEIKSFEVGPQTVMEIYGDTEFRNRLQRVVNSSTNKKRPLKPIKRDVNSIKIMSFDYYKHKTTKGVPNIGLIHDIEDKSYKVNLEEGEYNDLKGKIRKISVSPNTIVLFNKKNGEKDQIYINPSAKPVDKLCDINCDNLNRTKIVRYDEYYKPTDKYATVFEFDDYNSEKDGYEIKLLKGRYTIEKLKKLGIRDPISSLKISPSTTVILYNEYFSGTKKEFANKDPNYHKTIRSLNVNEIVDYNKKGRPKYHNWYGTIKSIEIY